MTQLIVRPHDPMVFRDARSFSGESGNLARTLPWPTPSVTAGFVRSALGRAAGGGLFHPDRRAALLGVEVHGPLLLDDGTVHLPAPRDLVVIRSQGESRVRPLLPLRPTPLASGEGMTLPDPRLVPAMAHTPEKASPTPPFWSLDRMTEWLADPERFSAPSTAPDPSSSASGFRPELPTDERTQVRIDPASGRSAEGLLYTVRSVAFAPTQAIVVRVRTRDPELSRLVTCLQGLHPLGGERRLAEVCVDGPAQGWQCPGSIRERLGISSTVRLVLATPAVFAGGWRPGWLTGSPPRGRVPGTEVEVELVAAVVDRWRPLSGWDLARNRAKRLRRMAPAGSVYFLRVLGGQSRQLAERWLEPVSDDPQDGCDGFGLALWGVWHEGNGKEASG